MGKSHRPDAAAGATGGSGVATAGGVTGGPRGANCGALALRSSLLCGSQRPGHLKHPKKHRRFLVKGKRSDVVFS